MTWLSNVLVLLLKEKDWACGNLVPFYGKRAQEIDPRYFFLTGNSKTNVFLGISIAFAQNTQKVF